MHLSLLQQIGLIGYWLSFTLIGLSILLAIRHIFKIRPLAALADTKLDTIVILFIATCLGIAAMGIGFVPAYMSSISLAYLTAYYYLLVSTSIVILLLSKRTIWQRIKQLPRDRLLLAIAGAAILMTCLNTAIAWHSGESIMYDSPPQMARINFVSNDHISLRDPLLGYNGVYDSRYSINAIASILGVGAHILNIDAMTIWVKSFAWITTILALAVASLCAVFIKTHSKLTRQSFGIVALALAPLLANVHRLFPEANMPSKTVAAWQALFMIGLYLFYKTGNGWLLIVGSLLIAMTQPMVAAAAIAFIGLLLLVMLVARLITWRQTAQLIIAVLILAAPVILQFCFPSKLQDNPQAWKAIDGSYDTLRPTHVWNWLVAKPHLTFSYLQLSLFLGAGLGLILLRKIHNKYVQVLCLVTLSALSLRFYSQDLAILIGITYLIFTVKGWKMKLSIFFASTLYAMIVYNPPLLTALQEKFPLWALVRVQSWNVFALAAIFATLYAAFILPGLKWGFKRAQWLWYAGGVSCVLLAATALNYGLPAHPYAMHPIPEHETRDTFQPFAKQLDGKIVLVVSDWTYDSSYIPAIGDAYVVGGFRLEHASPMSHILLRTRCVMSLANNLDPAELRDSKITTLLIQTTTQGDFLRRVQASGYFTQRSSQGAWTLFELTKQPDVPPNPYSLCNIPHGQ